MLADYAQNYTADAHSMDVPSLVVTCIGDYFRSLFGEQAGWAQAVLFAADLKEKQRIASSPVEETESDTKSADSSSVAKRMRLEAKLL